MHYAVFLEPFAERHFVKSFCKKYKGAWNITFATICEEFAQIDLLFLKSIAATVLESGAVKICKTEFKIAGTHESRHGSGNRCIVAVHADEAKVHILLVYAKTDLSGKNETAKWKLMVQERYPQYRHLF